VSGRDLLTLFCFPPIQHHITYALEEVPSNEQRIKRLTPSH